MMKKLFMIFVFGGLMASASLLAQDDEDFSKIQYDDEDTYYQSDDDEDFKINCGECGSDDEKVGYTDDYPSDE